MDTLSVSIACNQLTNNKLDMRQKNLPLLFSLNRHLLITLLLLFSGIHAFSQNTVKGIVRDSNDGSPLPGISVLLKNTAKGVVTDVNGSYSIMVPDGATLVFTHIGYETQERPVGTNSNINVSLKPETNTLNEVVVVGYGTQKRASLTGAISSVNSKDLENHISNNVLNSIAGQLSGVQVTSSTGRPGASPVIRIRGTSSISAGNQPLYVVDGFPLVDASDINLINPEDIETIDVLKDASASAIYGSRGSNGVVLITTKKGKVGQSRMDFSYYTGVQDVPKKLDMQTRDQEIQFWKENTAALYKAVGGDPSIPNGSRTFNESKNKMNYLSSFDDPSSLPNTDWQDVFLHQSAPTSNYQLSAQGGTEKIRYYLSGNYINTDGIIKSTDWKRFTGRVNVDATVNKYVRAGINLSPSYSLENRRNTDGHINSGDIDADIMMSSLVQSTTIAPKNAAGLYNGNGGNLNLPYATVGYAGANSALQIIENPDYKYTEEKLRYNGIAYLELEPLKELIFRTDFGLSTTNSFTNKYRPSTVSVVSGTQQVGTVQSPVASNIANILSNHLERRDITYSWNNTLTWQKIFNQDHSLNVLAGYSYQKAIGENANVFGTAGSFQNDLVKYVSGAANITGNAGKDQWNLLSYLARINYAYKSKYLLSGTIRRDGSSRFGANNKFAVFPALSVGWRISEESFLKSLTFLSELKLRAGYGEAGNFNIGNYASVAGLGTDNYSFGNALAVGYAPSGLGNTSLTWENTRTKDVGIDIGLFNSRVAITMDYYDKITDGLLYNLPVPALTGFGSILANIGKIQNKGFELSINSVNITKKEFQWSTNFNFSRNRNKVLALGKRNDPIPSGTTEGGFSQQRFQVGMPMSYFYGYKLGGIFRDQADVDAHPEMRLKNAAGALLGGPGDSKIVDVNGDGVITSADQTMIGDPNAKFTYGMSNRISFKAFDLDVQLQGVQGGDVVFVAARFLGTNNLDWSQLAEPVQNRWKSPSEPGNGIYPKAGGPGTTQVGLSETQADRWIRDASYLRVRNVTLGYNLPAAYIKRVHLSSVRIYTSVENLYTFTNYIGYNPDISQYGESTSTPGVDYLSYPLARTFRFGINLGL